MATPTQKHPTAGTPEALWTPLVIAVSATDYSLTAGVLTQLITLMRATSPSLPGKKEFLLPLDAAGQPVVLPANAIAALQTALKDTPSLLQWLSLVTQNATKTVLIARTLCHRIGLRHGTVQLILDHATCPDYTFLQIRGFHKADAPGEFDMPCAGHTVACDTAEISLLKELTEEIGLTGDDLEEIRCVGRYEHRETTTRTDFINVEIRTVYRARLRSQSMAKLHFADGEVAALTMITRDALHELVSRHPDRVASGLLGTLPWYGE
jgi:8-oxo-dGTP pyrophosphatase MutT (NUDIX family)